MSGIRTATTLTRALCAASFALLLALRLLSPAGFMPAFSAGTITIVACPDAEPPPAVHHAAAHHHGKSAAAHQPCPYASASPAGVADTGMLLLAAALLVGAALLLGRTFQFIARYRNHDRPPLRGPPLAP